MSNCQRICVTMVLLGIATPPQAYAQRVQTQRGATVGGIAGAVIGGIIGDNNDEAGAGAAIGGAIGAVTGGILGNAADKERAALQQQRYYQQQQIQVSQATQRLSAVSVNDVVNMSRSGLSDGVMINQIQQRGIQRQIQVSDIIALHQQGVRESVITAMQQAPIGNQAAIVQTRPVAPGPVIVEQPTIIRETHVLPAYPIRRHYYAPPRYHYSPRGYRTGIHIGF